MEIPGIIVWGAIAAIAILFFWSRSLKGELKATRATLSQAEKDLGASELALEATQEELSKERAYSAALRRNNDELQKLLTEKSAAMPWIVQLTADLHWAQDERDSRRLETKKRPAPSAAEEVRQHAKEKRELRIAKRATEYRIALYESLFPYLRDISPTDAEQVAETRIRHELDPNDPASWYVPPLEWQALSLAERYQRALDRYKNRARSDWEVGRDFERFIGYHWEKEGYDVIYHGAIAGFDDFGRDLIVRKGTSKVGLIQCKYWASHRTIPEASIFQLLGSAVSFFIETYGEPPTDYKSMFDRVQPYLYSTAPVAPRIRDIALAMGIKIKDDIKMRDWPMIKCNIAGPNRIYHLPMDQQYDRVKICRLGEFYASTVAEAEQAGFRRARRWVPDNN